MSNLIRAPWTREQVDALNRFQKGGVMHPFTCGYEHPAHPNPVLQATRNGWRCYVTGCDYEQDWAHAFMADPGMCPRFPFGERHGPTPQEVREATQATDHQDRRDKELEQLRRSIRSIMVANRSHVDRLTDAHQATIGELRRAEARVRVLEAEVAAARDQAAGEVPAELRISPAGQDTAGPARHVHVTITNPDEYTANRAALSLVDWVRSEFGDSLALHVTTDAREWVEEKTEEQS